jgi:ABC-2 type transport system permease protein
VVAQRALDSGEAAVAVIVPRGFAVRYARRDQPQVQVLIDGTDSTRAQVAANDATQFLLLHGIGGTGMGASAPASPSGPAVVAPPLEPRILYNPRLKTPVYMLPGILATLLLNVTAIVTAMGLSRERETGTLEQILVTPIRPAVLLAGKCLPFTLFGLVTVLSVMLLGSWLFEVPIRGSLAVVGVGAFLYLFSTLGIGVLIAAFSPSQQQAMLGAFGFILPAMLLSGFVSPVSSMPAWLRPMTALLPMRHFLEIMRGCLLKGAGFADLAPQLLALAVLGVGILWVSVARFRKRLA